MQPNGGRQGRMGLPPAGGSVSRRPTCLVLARPLTLALALAAGAARAATPPLAVPLALEESAGVARHAWPASASVPLPRGRVQSPDKLWLAAPDGHAAPLQARALERWPDGSVRWLPPDFLADVAAGKVATYTLRDSAPPAPASGARVRLEAGRDGARVLDSGALRVTVPARGEALLADLAAGPVRLAGAVPLPALAVDRAPGGAPSHEGLTVETEGAVRTELLVTGRYPAGIAYEVRIAAFAGERFLRLQHTITDLADPHYAPLRSLLLTVPGHFTEAAVGIDGGRRTLGELARGHELRHTDATPALLDGASAGRHADGWAEGRGGGAAVTLVAPFFWQEYPKALRVGADRLAIDLFAAKDTPVQFGTGAAKTHELWLALGRADDGASSAELAAALGAPLIAIPPAAWIVASRALPNAPTGSRLFLDGLVPAERHYRDVDIIHHASGHPDWVGLNHPHKALHFAFEAPEKVDLGHTWTEGLVTYHRLTGDVRALAAARGIADALAGRVKRARIPRHFGWPMLALVAVYDATGERRYLEAARAYADAGTDLFRPTPAAGDWKMGILADGVAAVYGADGDARLRRWLVAYADALLASPGRFADPRFAAPLGQLYALTGDARYKQAALATARGMNISDQGKQLAANGRTGFRILAPLMKSSGGPSGARAADAALRSPDAPRPRRPRW